MFIRGSNPVWSYVDLTGRQFDDTFYMFVLENDIPYIPATVFHDPEGNIPWTNPIRFLANGTLPIDIYWESDVVYRLEFRQGPTQQFPLIYLVENYVPGSSGSTPGEEAITTDNQITNPQFALINFVSPLALTGIGTQSIEIAPDWFLDLTGTGNTTLTQVALNNSVMNPTNAPYALQIQLSGTWTGAILRQRFHQTGVLWANTFVSSSIMALTATPPQDIQGDLFDSDGNLIANVLPPTPLTSNFEEYMGVGELPASLDTDLPPFAFIEYRITLPNTCNITLSSVQLVSGGIGITYTYEQTTVERQIDHTFHFYKNKLFFKPIPSLLTAWDFPLNPAQWGSTQSATTSASYIWDQTIVGTAVGNVGVVRNTVTGGINLVNGSANEGYYLLQYLSGAQVKAIIFNRLSVNINASTNGPTNVVMNVYLFRGSSSSVFPTLPTTIGTIANTGLFTLTAANWTQIPRLNQQQAQSSLAVFAFLTDFDINFSGWEVTDGGQLNDTDKFAIVVSFQVPTVSTSIIINSISCVPGLIPTRPAPQTFSDVLEECQHYYESSYSVGTAPGTAGAPGFISSVQNANSNGSSIVMTPSSFDVNYKTVKRITPSSSQVTIYAAASGNANNITGDLFGNGANVATGDIPISNYNFASNQKNAIYLGNNNTEFFVTAISTLNFWSTALYHYVVDVRIGH